MLVDFLFQIRMQCYVTYSYVHSYFMAKNNTTRITDSNINGTFLGALMYGLLQDPQLETK